MKEQLERTVVYVKDLSEQPPSSHVLIFDGGGATHYVSVDRWEILDRQVVGYYEREEVVAFPRGTPWNVFRRDLLDTPSKEQHMRRLVSDDNAMKALRKELGAEESNGDQPRGYM
jgi:hypothetical protein